MKKFKFVCFVAVLLIMITALGSCGFDLSLSSESDFDITTVLNKDYDTASLYNSCVSFEEFAEFRNMYTGSHSNEDFIVFWERDITKVYSFSEEKVVGVYVDGKEKGTGEHIGEVKRHCRVYLYDGIPVYVVMVSKTSTGHLTYDYMLYDYQGTKIAERLEIDHNKEFSGVEYIVDNVFTFDDVIYSFDSKGKVTKVSELPDYLHVSGLNLSGDKYYYSIADKSIGVYSHAFELCSYWEAPSYSALCVINVLNDGNILVQYTYSLAEDAQEYDYLSDGKKYKLVTLIVDAETGKEKKIKADFLIETLERNSDLFDKDAEATQNKYTDKFENLATIIYIKDKMLDIGSDHGGETVVLGNDGKIVGSVKLSDEQTDTLPRKIAEDRYMIFSKTGDQLIVNAEGEVIATIADSSLRYIGGYFVGKNSIYNADLEVVYSLKENNATYIDCVGDTLFIEERITERKYNIVSLHNKEVKTVFTYSASVNWLESFSVVENIGYRITDGMSETYTYYSVDGTKLLSFSYSPWSAENYLLELVNISEKYGVAIFKRNTYESGNYNGAFKFGEDIYYIAEYK